MGRTIPSFTRALIEEISEWSDFRKHLDKKERKAFDDMFAIARLYIPSCMCTANPVVMHSILLSIILRHYRELDQLVGRIEAITGERYDAISP
jgi:hypothetical protein